MRKKLSKIISTLEKVETGVDILWFGLRTLRDAFMITVTFIIACLYISYDGNITIILTDLIKMGDEQIKDTFEIIFVPILLILFVFRIIEFARYRKIKEEFKVSCKNMDEAIEQN